ncbi:MAG: acyl--CoA ligase [Solirubrobacterales bacterium]|jgi:acyl-CoA synthetase (AMP-forming)/AMP-acid ligase II|nr:acyl--CoA ligase [Solirubrobacterales bacterium]
MADGRVPLPAGVPERTVRDVLDARAASHPERVALIACSLLAGAEVARTYGELRAQAGRLASALADAGVEKGDRVAIMFDNDGAAEAHLAYHAAHRLGAITVPLNTRSVARELAYVLEVVAPAAIVFAPAFAPLLAGVHAARGDAALLEAGDTPTLGRSLAEALATGADDVAPAPLTEHDDADWIFTSGTTGKPKAVALTHGGSVACGIQAIPLWGLDATSTHQSFAPFFTSTGCHTNLLSALYAGCTLAVEPEFHVVRTIERMQRWGTTSTFLINSVMQLLFDRVGDDALAALELPALRRICHGGQPAGPAYYRRLWTLAQRMGIELTNVYGLTEGGTSGTMLVPEDHPAALERMGSFGLSIGRGTFHPWVEHAVVRADGAPVAEGEIGELLLRGPSTMSRYVDDPEATAAAIDRDCWLHTGDLCTRDAEGYLSFVDRSKQLIRRGGLNISSAEVEGVLMEHPGVAEAAVVPLSNPVLGQDVRGVVVAATEPPPTADELIAFCAVRLADYKVPARIDLVDALPRNAMGRVVKGALTGQAAALT